MYTGISTNGKPINAQLFEEMGKNGITHLEISVSNDACDLLQLDDIARMAADNGVTLWSYHLPFSPFAMINPASPDAEVRAFTLGRFTHLMGKAREAGVRTFVVHASAEPIADENRAMCMANARETLAALAAYAKSIDARVAVEDLPRSCLGNCSADILSLISADESLRVCFDTNHILKESAVDFIKNVGDKIVTLHVSDYDFINERHWLPGEGDLNWQEIIAALNAVGYKGPWLYEIGFACPKTIERDRDLTVRDFAENARVLFEGETPAPVGRRLRQKLGLWGPIEE